MIKFLQVKQIITQSILFLRNLYDNVRSYLKLSTDSEYSARKWSHRKDCTRTARRVLRVKWPRQIDSIPGDERRRGEERTKLDELACRSLPSRRERIIGFFDMRETIRFYWMGLGKKSCLLLTSQKRLTHRCMQE